MEADAPVADDLRNEGVEPDEVGGTGPALEPSTSRYDVTDLGSDSAKSAESSST